MKNKKLRGALITALGTVFAFAAMAFVGFLQVMKENEINKTEE